MNESNLICDEKFNNNNHEIKFKKNNQFIFILTFYKNLSRNVIHFFFIHIYLHVLLP